MVALGGFPRFAVKFKSNKGSLAQLIYLSLNEFMQNCWKKNSSVLVLLIVGQTHFFSSTHTEPLISSTTLRISYWSRQFHGSIWNLTWLWINCKHFCTNFALKQFFNIKLCHCKELSFSSVSHHLAWLVSALFLCSDTSPACAQKAKGEIQCGVVELGSVLGASKYRLQSSYPLTLCCTMESSEWAHNCLPQNSRDSLFMMHY